ncbi:MAG: MBL fold metallo-hydrolase [Lentisphaerae bacterium]|nr:MBL fold metallo-hydrolase [Lentisphaerota bacterium]
MKVCVLASSSSGNCIFAGSATTRILIDGGLTLRETVRRLELIGETLGAIQGICLTHEHSDHTAGLANLQGTSGIPLYANAGTIEAIRQDETLRNLKWQVFTTGAAFSIGDLAITPFSVSHDAYEPVGFVVTADSVRLGIVTDIGVSTHLVQERLRSCQVLLIESNHDERLLTDAQRPWHLKQRIAGRQGHLSNRHAAELIGTIASADLKKVFLCHLSQDCNRPELALKLVREALRQRRCDHVQVSLTYPHQNSMVWSDEELAPCKNGQTN